MTGKYLLALIVMAVVLVIAGVINTAPFVKIFRTAFPELSPYDYDEISDNFISIIETQPEEVAIFPYAVDDWYGIDQDIDCEYGECTVIIYFDKQVDETKVNQVMKIYKEADGCAGGTDEESDFTLVHPRDLKVKNEKGGILSNIELTFPEECTGATFFGRPGAKDYIIRFDPNLPFSKPEVSESQSLPINKDTALVKFSIG